MSDERIKCWLNEIRVLDGGMGSECQRRSHLLIDGHKAWSCRLLKDDPNLVCDIHKSFIRAGADVISTNTYQAAPKTLSEAMGITVPEAVELMRKAVNLVRRAISSVSEEEAIPINKNSLPNRKLPILIAGSLGPYGACLADGSEYTGSYADDMSVDELADFHLKRAEIMINAGVDFIAWETIPTLTEVAAICEVMRRLPGALAWLSVASENGQTVVGGSPLHQVALEADRCNQIFGIGVNCCISHDRIGTALSNLNLYYESCEAGTEDGFHPPPCSVVKRPANEEQLKRKLFVVYANSGEQWIPPPGNSKKRKGHWIWPQGKGPMQWAQSMMVWSMRRDPESRSGGISNLRSTYPLAQWVGGCCRVGPSQIRQLAEWMKPDEFCHPEHRHGTAICKNPPHTQLVTNSRRKRNFSCTERRKQPQRDCKRARSG